MTLHLADMVSYLPMLLRALGMSLYITVVAMALGSAIGVALYLGKRYGSRISRGLCETYIELFRNTPLLVQLYIIYFGLPQVGITIGPISAALFGLTINNSAYTAEIYRAGFDAVPKGLWEAGEALGLSRKQIFREIALPPATRNVFPPLTNQFILLFLASSIASIIGLPELMYTILQINSETYRTFEILIVGGALYFGSSALLAFLARYLERRLFRWAVIARV